MEFGHKRCKLVVNILESFRLFFECIYKAVFKIRNIAWYCEANDFL